MGTLGRPSFGSPLQIRQKPGDPGWLIAKGQCLGEIILSWADPMDVTITGYQYRYRTPTDSNWSPDWRDMSGSGPTTTSHTLTDLEWEVLHTFQLRAVRGSMVGPGRQVQGTPPEDLTRPSKVRGLAAVTRGDSEILVSFVAPVRPGNAAIRTYEYRYAQGSTVPTATPWDEMPSHLVAHRFFFVPDLAAGELHTFEVRAVNGNNKTGPEAEAQATPCCAPGAATEPPSPPSAPASISVTATKPSATATEPYTQLEEVNEVPARVAYVDLTVQWEPAVDHGNAVVSYQYRMAEGGSVPPSAPWLPASSDYPSDDELAFTVRKLRPGTRYTVEMRTVSSHGASTNTVQTSVLTPGFTAPATYPHYTMSAPSSAREGQAVTITVRRTNTGDGESAALVEIRDSNDNTDEIIQIHAAEFGSSATSATVTYTIRDDGQAITNRTLTTRIGFVRGGLVDRSTKNTYSVEEHTVNVTDTTP